MKKKHETPIIAIKVTAADYPACCACIYIYIYTRTSGRFTVFKTLTIKAI